MSTLLVGRPPIAHRMVVAPRRTATAPRERWPYALALVAFLLYVVVAYWLLYVRGYEIGDAVTKTSAAQHVIASRDPHLAAMGFYWMPLPQLSQVPFVWVLSHLGVAQFAGPLTTACWGAAVLPVLAAVARVCATPPQLARLMVVVYAVSPVALWTSANGMSEAPSFFFLALALLGYAQWVRSDATGSLALAAIGLGGLMLCRYEALPVAAALAVCCALQVRRERWLSTVTVVMLPALYMFALWLLASKLIMKDAFFWLKTLLKVGKGSGNGAAVYTANPTVIDMVRFGLLMTVVMTLLMLVLLPTVLARRPRQLVRNLGFAAPGLVFPAIVFVQQMRATAPGQTRYYYPAWIVSIVMGMDLAGRMRHRYGDEPRRWARPVVHVVIGVVAAVSVGGQALGLSDARVSSVESEHLLFAPLIGRTSTLPPGVSLRERTDGWKALFATVDGELGSGAALMLDTDSSPEASLFTRHPDRLVIPEDRDFEQTLAAPEGRVDYIAFRTAATSAATSRFLPEMKAVVASTSKGRWTKVAEFGTDPNLMLELYRAEP